MLKDILDFCNKIRKTHGQPPMEELVPGLPLDPTCCPIANTVKHNTNYIVFVSKTYVFVRKSYTERCFPVTDVVREFIRKFDRGEYPDYEN